MIYLQNAYKAMDGKIFEEKSDCLKHDCFLILRDHYKHNEDCPDINALKWVVENHVDISRFLRDLRMSIIEK